jgi:nickel transport protein
MRYHRCRTGSGWRFWSVLLSVWLGITAPAMAHQILVFAAADGAMIAGRAYFPNGDPVSGAQVRIEDGRGRLLAGRETGPDGRFRYRARFASDHHVVVSSGDGHRAEWVVSAAELAPAFVSTQGDANAPATIDPALATALERAVARQLAPLREELAAARAQVGLRDVLGGLGYILGLVGLALFWRSRSASGGGSSGTGRGTGA